MKWCVVVCPQLLLNSFLHCLLNYYQAPFTPPATFSPGDLCTVKMFPDTQCYSWSTIFFFFTVFCCCCVSCTSHPMPSMSSRWWLCELLEAETVMAHPTVRSGANGLASAELKMGRWAELLWLILTKHTHIHVPIMYGLLYWIKEKTNKQSNHISQEMRKYSRCFLGSIHSCNQYFFCAFFN